MNKLVFTVCATALLYLGFHGCIAGAEAWANRNYDEEAFQRGECTKTYYCMNI